jgi:phage baseplate assembly protein V
MKKSSNLNFGGVNSDNTSRFGALKPGIVTQHDLVQHRVKVQWLDQDGVESFWLPVLKMFTGGNKHYALPDLGEQVICLTDFSQEDGIVLGSIYSDKDATPVESLDKTHVSWSDGGFAEYDRQAHTAELIHKGKTLLRASDAAVYLDGTNVVCESDVYAVVGALAVSLANHTHSAVYPGTGVSGPPVTVPAPPVPDRLSTPKPPTPEEVPDA